jgi:hypothetical protein
MACFHDMVENLNPYEITPTHPPCAVRAEALISASQDLGLEKYATNLKTLFEGWRTSPWKRGYDNRYAALTRGDLIEASIKSALHFCSSLDIRPCTGKRVESILKASPLTIPSALKFTLDSYYRIVILSSMAPTQFPPAATNYPLSFDTVANSLALRRNATPLESSKSELFAQNTRGMGWVSRTQLRDTRGGVDPQPRFTPSEFRFSRFDSRPSLLPSLSFHQLTNRSSQPSICKSLRFHNVTNRFFRNSRIFTSLQIAGGVGGHSGFVNVRLEGGYGRQLHNFQTDLALLLRASFADPHHAASHRAQRVLRQDEFHRLPGSQPEIHVEPEAALPAIEHQAGHSLLAASKIFVRDDQAGRLLQRNPLRSPGLGSRDRRSGHRAAPQHIHTLDALGRQGISPVRNGGISDSLGPIRIRGHRNRHGSVKSSVSCGKEKC